MTNLPTLSERGTQFMQMVANSCQRPSITPYFDFFDEGAKVGSGNWGENMAAQYAEAYGHNPKSSGGVMQALLKHGLFVMNDQEDGTWWALTELGVEFVKSLMPSSDTPPEKEPKAKPTRATEKVLTRAECLERLKKAGYTGPTSYLMPRLREIVKEVESK